MSLFKGVLAEMQKHGVETIAELDEVRKESVSDHLFTSSEDAPKIEEVDSPKADS